MLVLAAPDGTEWRVFPRKRRLAWFAAPIVTLLAIAGVLVGAPQSAQAAPIVGADDAGTGVRYLHDPDNPGAGATVWGAFAEDQMGGGHCLLYAVGSGSLETVTFPSSVTISGVAYTVVGIESHAFDWVRSSGGCEGRVTFGWATIVIPPTVTWIGEGAFHEAQVGNIIFDPGGQLATIGAQAFTGIQQKDFTIPASVTSIGAQAFFVGLSQTFTFLGDPPSVGHGANYNQTFTRFAGNPVQYATLYFNCDATGVTFPTWNGYNTVPSPGQVCYDPNGGSGGLVRQAGTGTITLDAPAPTLTNYTLSSWNTASGGGGTAYANGASVTLGAEEGLYLYAQWTGVTITHSFDGNGSTGGATASVSGKYGTDTTLPGNSFTRAHYNFTGWGLTSDATTLVAPGTLQTLTENTTWYARWAPHAYTLTADLAGGTVGFPVIPSSYTIESNWFVLTPPTRAGYSFAGWTGTGLGGPTLYLEIPTGSTGDRSYTATWSVVDYVVSYDLAGGTAAVPADPVSYTIESDAFSLTAPTRAGYSFTGWTGTGLGGPTDVVEIPAGSTGNRSYTATWSPVDYVIDYDLAGGTEGSPVNPVSYTIESDELVLGIPTLAGHTFLGWEGTDLLEPTRDVLIPAGSMGDRHYTAVWAEVLVTLDRAHATTGAGVLVHVAGLLPGGSYAIVMHSTPIVLTTLAAAGDGTLLVLVTIPSGAPLGPHTIAVAPADDVLATLAAADFTVLALASTGVDVTHGVFLTTMLLAFGLVLLVGSRRLA